MAASYFSLTIELTCACQVLPHVLRVPFFAVIDLVATNHRHASRHDGSAAAHRSYRLCLRQLPLGRVMSLSHPRRQSLPSYLQNGGFEKPDVGNFELVADVGVVLLLLRLVAGMVSQRLLTFIFYSIGS